MISVFFVDIAVTELCPNIVIFSETLRLVLFYLSFPVPVNIIWSTGIQLSCPSGLVEIIERSKWQINLLALEVRP